MAQVKPCTCQPFAHEHVGSRCEGLEAVRVTESAVVADSATVVRASAKSAVVETLEPELDEENCASLKRWASEDDQKADEA